MLQLVCVSCTPPFAGAKGWFEPFWVAERDCLVAYINKKGDNFCNHPFWLYCTNLYQICTHLAVVNWSTCTLFCRKKRWLLGVTTLLVTIATSKTPKSNYNTNKTTLLTTTKHTTLPFCNYDTHESTISATNQSTSNR